MYKKCKTEESAKRQKQFAECLMQLMEKKNFSDITITELCSRMNAPRNAFYRYFDSLEDVLYSYLDDILLESFLIWEGDDYLIHYFDYWRRHKKILDLLEKNQLSAYLYARGQLLSQKDDSKELEQEEMMNAFYIAGLLTFVTMWHHEGMIKSSEEMMQIIKSAILLEGKMYK